MCLKVYGFKNIHLTYRYTNKDYHASLHASMLVMFWDKQQLMMHFIQNLSLNFHSLLELYMHDNNRWYRISTSYWVENLQLSFCWSVKSTHEFKWYTKTLWPNWMKMLG